MSETKVKNILEKFSQNWPADRLDYRRTEDESWKIYGLSLKELLLEGKKAVPELEIGLKSPNKQVRALCSRALGFLNADTSIAGLADAVYNDSWETVRLLAADSLGMIFTTEAKEILNNALEREKHKDVKLHIRIALRRESIIIGEPAPGFTLRSCDGSRFTLSGYLGKKKIILIFLYGDG